MSNSKKTSIILNLINYLHAALFDNLMQLDLSSIDSDSDYFLYPVLEETNNLKRHISIQDKHSDIDISSILLRCLMLDRMLIFYWMYFEKTQDGSKNKIDYAIHDKALDVISNINIDCFDGNQINKYIERQLNSFKDNKNIMLYFCILLANRILDEINSYTDFRCQKSIHKIIKSISFPPEYQQAGITILSQFANIVREKYKDQSVNVTITQDGHDVILVIETHDGVIKEQVVETMKDYHLVLIGDKTPEQFLDNRVSALELRQQLRIAKIQLENKIELLEVEKRHSSQLYGHNLTLQKQYDEIVNILSLSLANSKQETQLIINALNNLSSQSLSTTRDALCLIKTKFENGIIEDDEEEIKKALNKIKTNDPGIFKRIIQIFESTSTSVAGNYLYNWLVSVSHSLPIC